MSRSRRRHLAGLLILLAGFMPGQLQAAKLAGAAEDLWGNRIVLSEYNQGMMIVLPFSPSN